MSVKHFWKYGIISLDKHRKWGKKALFAAPKWSKCTNQTQKILAISEYLKYIST